MFKKKDNFPESFDTLIGINSYFEGNIQSEGTVRVEGKIKGDLKINGDLFIGSEAIITGNITAKSIHISGAIEGNILSGEMLRLLSTSKVTGNIHVHSFVADEGAFFQGNCSMVDVLSGDDILDKGFPKKTSASREYKKSAVLDEKSFETKE